ATGARVTFMPAAGVVIEEALKEVARQTEGSCLLRHDRVLILPAHSGDASQASVRKALGSFSRFQGPTARYAPRLANEMGGRCERRAGAGAKAAHTVEFALREMSEELSRKTLIWLFAEPTMDSADRENEEKTSGNERDECSYGPGLPSFPPARTVRVAAVLPTDLGEHHKRRRGD